jgi:hypothetical protein
MRDIISRSDTGEELSYRSAESGEMICLVYPKHYYPLTDQEIKETGNPEYWSLGGKFKYGLMTQYSDLLIHCGMQNIKRGNRLFIDKCKEIIGHCTNVDCNKKLEAVTVCVGYSRFLDITLKENIRHFDNIVVVTTPDDHKTQELIDKYSGKVTCVTTNRFYSNKSIFNKGGGINEGLKRLKYNNFVCHIDCDIVLPDNFRSELKLDTLDSNVLYGCRRFFIDKYQDWLYFKNGEKNKDDFYGLDLGGWGCGYIQIWDMRSPKLRSILLDDIYPSYPTAGESDILMLKRFHPNVEDVGKLNIDVAHLGNCGVSHDTNDSKYFFD